jgi:glycosyltransferase involved in cell wall biosynthesis
VVGRWCILTGEYPPQPGGVADYTRAVAAGLALAGDEVHVWAPPAAGPTPVDDGVAVRRLPNSFGPKSLHILSDELDRLPAPRTLLVQYVPHAFGFKAMNVWLCRWVAGRRRAGDRIAVMYHEAWFPSGGRLRHRLLHHVTRWMARTLYRAADRVYVAIPTWGELLRQTGDHGPTPVWCPVPSNVPHVEQRELVAMVRSRLVGAEPRGQVVGHFGTYPPAVTAVLGPTIGLLLTGRSSVRVVLLGRGGERFRAALIRDRPDWAGRIVAPGELPADELSVHLQACDLMVQPLPDGVSSRRGSVMAALANGVPVVTTYGQFSESTWRDEPGVALTDNTDPSETATAAIRMLENGAGRAALGLRGRELYERRFALRHTIATLRGQGPDAGGS